jgi:SAM-dependent methyltransferase
VTALRHAARAGLDRLPAAARFRLLWTLRPLLYRGDQVQCPCCGGTFDRFMTHRGVPNVRCPRCGSMERHRLLWLWLDRHPEFLRGARRVLHIAPEPPLRRRFDGDRVQYITADLASPYASVHCDIQDLPFKDGWFDLVVCNHVLEHIPDDRLALSELHRVQTPGGRAILLCPIATGLAETLEDPAVHTPAQRLATYGQEDHARLYGSDYPDRIRDAGFDVDVVDFLAELDPDTIERHAVRRRSDLFDTDTLYLASKP